MLLLLLLLFVRPPVCPSVGPSCVIFKRAVVAVVAVFVDVVVDVIVIF